MDENESSPGPVARQLNYNDGGYRSEFDFTTADFQRVRELAREKTGISLAEHKSQLVYSRLSRRLRALALPSFSVYLAMLDADSRHSEWPSFINALTTNLTSFFREAHHFTILADYLRSCKTAPTIWCCAASTGEEPYSIAMTLRETLGSTADCNRILATDIDTDALATARRGVYSINSIDKLDDQRRKQFFLRGNGASSGLVRVRRELTDIVDFRALNLVGSDWQLESSFDIVFCRNLIIYFDSRAQKTLVERLAEVIRPGGLLIIGHSENLSRMTDAFALQGQTVYRRTSRGASLSHRPSLGVAG